MFGKVLSKVLDLTHRHEYYQIKYLDSLTILSTPERLPSSPFKGRTRKGAHDLKRRDHVEHEKRRTRSNVWVENATNQQKPRPNI